VIKEDTHWRDSARIPRFFIIDSRAAFAFLIFVLHIRLWTLYTAIGVIIMFWIIERYGFTVPVFLRLVRTFLGGSRKTAVPWWKY